MSLLERPHFAIIPYEVRIDSNLKSPHRELYGELIGLSKKFGYLFAEDEQISEMMNIPIRTIQRYLKKLEDAGHIKRRTKNVHWLCDDGKTRWKKKRKIYFKDNFPNDLDEDKPCFQKKIAEPPILSCPLEPPILADITKRTVTLKEQQTAKLKRRDPPKPTASVNPAVVAFQKLISKETRERLGKLLKLNKTIQRKIAEKGEKRALEALTYVTDLETQGKLRSSKEGAFMTFLEQDLELKPPKVPRTPPPAYIATLLRELPRWNLSASVKFGKIVFDRIDEEVEYKGVSKENVIAEVNRLVRKYGEKV